MSRDEYLKQLRLNIAALPLDEQNEAMEYYYCYFEDAGNDEKVIEELGSPEKLAAEIKEKFACVPATSQKADYKQKTEHFGSNASYSGSSAQSFMFSTSEVRSLDLSIAMAEVVVISGENYKIESRGFEPGDLNCSVSPYGTLLIENKRKMPLTRFFERGESKNWHPRLLVTVPGHAKIDTLKIRIGAGSLVTKDVNIEANRACMDVGAGNLVLGKIESGRSDIRCGMGNLEFSGKLTSLCKIDCGMGSVKIKVEGNAENYSYDSKVGLGEVVFNKEKKAGVAENASSSRKENHFSINCGMGAVHIEFTE